MWDITPGWWAPPHRYCNSIFSSPYKNGFWQCDGPDNKENVEGWKHKVIDDWSSLDVLYWFLSELRQLQVKDPAAVRLENFVQMEGGDLKTLSMEDFKKMIPGFGDLLYLRLQTKMKEEKMIWENTGVHYRCGPDPYILTDLDKNSCPVFIKLETPRYYYDEKSSSKLWMKKNVNEWTPRDVLDWILYEFYLLRVSNPEAFGLERFAGLDGIDINRMTLEEFDFLIPHHGKKLHHRLQMRKRFNEGYQHLKTEYEPSRIERNLDPPVVVEPLKTICKPEPPLNHTAATSEHTPSNTPDDDRVLNLAKPNQKCGSIQPEENDLDQESNCSPSGLTHEYDSETSIEEKTPATKRPVGRPRGSLKKERSREKVGRVWEFIRDLLMDARYNPSIISWEDRAEGVFRFENSEQVANLWGCRRSNPRMNYGYFTRSIRHNYKKGYLLPVEKKRRVYKFGPKSLGWRIDDRK